MIKSEKDLLEQIDMFCNEPDELRTPIRESEAFYKKDISDEIFNVSNIQINGKFGMDQDLDHTSFTDNMELNEIYQYLNSDDHKILTNKISKMSDIVQEDDQILDYFASSIEKCHSNEDLIKYLEA